MVRITFDMPHLYRNRRRKPSRAERHPVVRTCLQRSSLGRCHPQLLPRPQLRRAALGLLLVLRRRQSGDTRSKGSPLTRRTLLRDPPWCSGGNNKQRRRRSPPCNARTPMGQMSRLDLSDLFLPIHTVGHSSGDPSARMCYTRRSDVDGLSRVRG